MKSSLKKTPLFISTKGSLDGVLYEAYFVPPHVVLDVDTEKIAFYPVTNAHNGTNVIKPQLDVHHYFLAVSIFFWGNALNAKKIVKSREVTFFSYTALHFLA
jgi:hypothetical protein